MISRDVVRQSLKTLAPSLFLMLCCSIGAFAQAPSAARQSAQAAKAVSFKDAALKATISDVGNQLSLNVVFDDSVRDDKLNLELKDVTAKQVMKIILIWKKLQARTIEENTIIVFPDNDTNRKIYAGYETWPAKSDTGK
jgi:type II secretory pathway component GspD/PulD (secretin)